MSRTWKNKTRKIGGKMRRVKVRKVGETEQVRVKGFANTTDSGGKRHKVKQRRGLLHR